MNILMTLNHALPMHVILRHAAKVLTFAIFFAAFLQLCYNKSLMTFKMLANICNWFTI